MRAWNVAHKTMYAPTLIKAGYYNQNIQHKIGFMEQPNSFIILLYVLCSFPSKMHVCAFHRSIIKDLRMVDVEWKTQ